MSDLSPKGLLGLGGDGGRLRRKLWGDVIAAFQNKKRRESGFIHGQIVIGHGEMVLN